MQDIALKRLDKIIKYSVEAPRIGNAFTEDFAL